MSLGNDFIGGFQATRAIREKRLDRDQQSALEKARRDLELERDLKRGQLERDLQGERITADAVKQFNSQTWTGGENEKDRKHRTGERVGTQAHQSTESELDRAARLAANERTLNQAAQQFTKRLDFDQQNMGLGAGLKARELETRNDPDSMNAQLNAERLKKLKRENADNETVTPGVTPKATGAFTTPTPPPAHAIAFLKANPSAAADFKKKYGVDPQQFLGR